MSQVFVYCRVSGEKQEKGCAAQEAIGRLCAAQQRLGEVTNVYKDDATSTLYVPFEDRPGVQALLSVLKKDDHVIVQRLDRIERGSQKKFYNAIYAFLDKDVCIHSVEERNGLALDLSNATGRALLSIWQIASDFYRSMIQENTRRSKQYAKSQGWFLGGAIPLWHKLVRNEIGKVVAVEWDHAQLAIVAEVAARLGKGEPVAAVARDLWNRNVLDGRGMLWGFHPRTQKARCHYQWELFYRWVREFRRMGIRGQLPAPYTMGNVMLGVPISAKFTPEPVTRRPRKKAEVPRVTPIYDCVLPWSPWHPSKKPIDTE